MQKSFVEYLEECRDLKRKCVIRFRDVQGMENQVEGHIIRLEEVSGREIIETDAGFVIGMDQILALNGRPAGDYC